jgi:hypothetical protein
MVNRAKEMGLKSKIVKLVRSAVVEVQMQVVVSMLGTLGKWVRRVVCHGKDVG